MTHGSNVVSVRDDICKWLFWVVEANEVDDGEDTSPLWDIILVATKLGGRLLMNLLATRNDDDANDDDDIIKSKNNLAPPTMGGSTVLYAELIDASNGMQCVGGSGEDGDAAI